MKRSKVIVHNPCNEHTRYYRNYNYFWDVFTSYLKNYFDVEENRDFEQANSERWKIKPAKETSDNFLLLECEYVLESADTGEFHVISVADNLNHASLNERSNPYCKSILLSQFHPLTIRQHVGEYYQKYKPWVYFQSGLQDLNVWYEKRKYVKEKENKLYFRGTSLQDRTFLIHINKDYITDFNPIDPNSYFNEIIHHKLAISIDGRGEFCYRDIECFALGVPIIRFEYESIMDEPLIPNYHYVSIPRPSDMVLYRQGNENHAELFMQRYFEVINDSEFLNYISQNARRYYENNLTYESVLKKTHRLMELNSWMY